MKPHEGEKSLVPLGIEGFCMIVKVWIYTNMLQLSIDNISNYGLKIILSKYCSISKNEVFERTIFPVGLIKNVDGILKTP